MSFSLIVLQLEKILQYPHGVVYIGEVILYIINLMNKALLAIFILVISASCKRSPSDLSFKSKDDLVRRNQLATGEAPLNFNSLQKYILKPKCMSCHSGPDAKPNNDPIDFTTYDSTMVDRFIPLLVKGKPQKSRLFLSVEDGEMPVEGTLSNVEIEFIKKWIEACAPKETPTSIPDNCDGSGDNDDGPGDNGPGDDDGEPGNDDGEPGDDEGEPGDDEGEPGNDNEPGWDEPLD
jgi:hypothetical protein